MSSSLHLFDPQKSIRFVKGGDLADLQSVDDKPQLNGEEIRRFYEDLISQPSTSTTAVKVEVKKEELDEPIQKPVQQQLIRVSKIELTERDERLFFKAAQLDDVETLYKYLQSGMDVNLKDSFGWNALMCASAGGGTRAIQLLLQFGVDYEYSVNGMNAEKLAKKNKHTSIAKFIAAFRHKQHEERTVEVHDLVEEKYCKVCDKTHFDSNHDTSILHILKLNERPAEGYYYGINASNPGYRLLKLGDWKEGQGLGKMAEGRKYPIRTTLKRDTKGLGLEKKSQMKITHFESMDPLAIKSAKKPPRRSYIRQLDKEIARKKEREIKLRRSLM